MAVVQEAFDIPSDILTRILSGEYRRIGGVVRYAVGSKKGQIVKHLKPVPVEKAEAAKNLGAKALEFAKNNKKGLLLAGIAAGVAAGVGIYHKIKTREPEVVKRFRKEFSVYINAIREGKLDVIVIDNLMKALDDLKKHKDYKSFKVQISTEDLDVLLNKIYDYTMKLAKDNGVELLREERIHSKDSIVNLEQYLKTQKRIFEIAA